MIAGRLRLSVEGHAVDAASGAVVPYKVVSSPVDVSTP